MKWIADIPLFWIVPILIGCYGMAYLFYFLPKKTGDYSLKTRWILTTLRGTGLFCIALLLLGIFIERTTYREEKPILFVALDNSSSMLNFADSTAVKVDLPKKISELNEQLGDKYLIKPLSFGVGTTDSLNFAYNEAKTNIAAVFENIHEKYLRRNIGAILLISDGNHNEGISPFYPLQKLDFVPVYSIGIGDTFPKKDASIDAMIANEVAFAGNLFPIEVRGKLQEMKGIATRLELYQNKQLIATQDLPPANSNEVHFTHRFQVVANGKGYQRFTAKIISQSKEHTYSNNIRSVYIEYLDTKNSILVVSTDIHPDIGAICSVLQQEKGTELNIQLWDKLSTLPNYDLLIFRNPDFSKNVELWKQIQAAKKPILYLLSPSTSVNAMRSLNIGMQNAGSKGMDRVQAIINTAFSAIQFSADFNKRISSFPPLQVPFSKDWPTQMNTLLFQQMGAVQLQRPLVAFQVSGAQKIGYVFGEDLWQWKMYEQTKYKSTLVFDEFIAKITQYLVAKENTSKLRVYPPKNASQMDDILFKAEFYNDAFQLITEPEVHLELRDEKKQVVSKSTFLTVEKAYQLNLGRLSAGKYAWKATCSFAGKKYEKTGEFVVHIEGREAGDLVADFHLLRELSSASKGKFYSYSNINSAITDLAQRDDITSVRYDNTDLVDLLDFKLLFFIIIILFIAEWTIRRWLGTY